jgi:hypothetical protein
MPESEIAERAHCKDEISLRGLEVHFRNLDASALPPTCMTLAEAGEIQD